VRSGLSTGADAFQKITPTDDADGLELIARRGVVPLSS
jgi:hypothetical protein